MKKNNIRILAITNTCSENMYGKLCSLKSSKLNPSQKFFKLLFEGIANNDCTIESLSIRSIDPSNCKEKKLVEERDAENDVCYYYPEIINGKIAKIVSSIINTKKCAKNVMEDTKTEEIVLLVDALSFVSICTAIAIKRKYRVKMIFLITDLPNYVSAINKNNGNTFVRRIKDQIINLLLQQADAYCFLTESMNKVNKKNKPYVVVEGISTPKKNSDNITADSKFRIMYAGGLYEKFGVKDLVDAMSYITVEEIELWLYGEGDLVEYIQSVEEGKKIYYGGYMSSQEIFERELTSKLLINPRPTKEAFTKYSFPSKTMEYLSTGVPVLTTKLQGIPKTYDCYLNYIDDESPQGIAKSIMTIYESNYSDYKIKAKKGKEFVELYKNPKVQGKVLIDLAKHILKFSKCK